jgi:hypothetical protein
MGTPDEQRWPGVSNLPDYKETFPRWEINGFYNGVTRFLTSIDLLLHVVAIDRWHPRNLAELVPSLDPAGVDLLRRMLVYLPQVCPQLLLCDFC